MLSVRGLKASYGSIQVLQGLDLEIGGGEIVCLIGANGAGKSTVLKVISGLVRPTEGSITFMGKDIASLPAHVIARNGLVHVPEGRRIFSLLTVKENLQVGAFLSDKATWDEKLQSVYTMFPVLKDRASQLGGTLSGGEQQMLAIGRALMADPKLLLLDEPSMGLAPLMVDRIFEAIRSIAATGISVFLVEQNATMALESSDRAYVMERGRVILSAPSSELISDPAVVRAYLGGKA